MQPKQHIIGIDPGSRITGYGIIWVSGTQQGLVIEGSVRCRQVTLSQRLQQIYQSLTAILAEHQPQTAAIEQVFTCRNAQSALKLGQARGAALIALAGLGLNIHEYSARQVKKSVVGYGAAEKFQIQQMVRSLLRLTHTPEADAADALAIAICHANHQHLQQRLMEGTLT